MTILRPAPPGCVGCLVSTDKDVFVGNEEENFFIFSHGRFDEKTSADRTCASGQPFGHRNDDAHGAEEDLVLKYCEVHRATLPLAASSKKCPAKFCGASARCNALNAPAIGL